MSGRPEEVVVVVVVVAVIVVVVVGELMIVSVFCARINIQLHPCGPLQHKITQRWGRG